MATVCCVLRSGGDYGPEHVDWLRRQILRHNPGVRFVCYTDMGVPGETMPLEHRWPGWWSKLEVMSPALPGDLIFVDLDTVCVGSVAHFAGLRKTTALRDVNNRAGERTLQSSVMFLTQSDRRTIWDAFTAAPEHHMNWCAGGGDQRFIGSVLTDWQAFQDVLPGELISYKVGMLRHDLTAPPAGTRLVVFHGKPRPWHVQAEWIPKING